MYIQNCNRIFNLLVHLLFELKLNWCKFSVLLVELGYILIIRSEVYLVCNYAYKWILSFWKLVILIGHWDQCYALLIIITKTLIPLENMAHKSQSNSVCQRTQLSTLCNDWRSLPYYFWSVSLDILSCCSIH